MTRLKYILVYIITVTNSLHGSSESSWTEQTLKKMSLREKIGQLFIATIGTENLLATHDSMKFLSIDQEYINNLIQKHHVGGIIFLGTRDLESQVKLTNHYQSLSVNPLLVLEDLEWGLTMRLKDGVRFPRNIALAAIQDEKLISELGEEIGRECKEIGVHINLAPVVDINNNAKNPVIGTRSFGENKNRVALLGALFMKGLQNVGILACAKHFPGHGDTDQDSHKTLPLIAHNIQRLHDIELFPFTTLISEGVAAIMPAHLKIPALDEGNVSTVSHAIVTKLLQDNLGFKGLIITDALCMGALNDYEPGDTELKAFLAGNDIFVCSRDIIKAITTIQNAIITRKISEEELDKRVLKILRAKEKLNIHNNRYTPENNLATRISTPKALELKKQLYSAALTLIKNNNSLIPLQTNTRVHIVQCGGKINSDFITELYNAGFTQSSHITAFDSLQYKKAHENVQQADTVIVALFDIKTTTSYKNFGIPQETCDFIISVKNTGKRVILVIFGNPYSLALFGNEDAIMMAYEDDPDAQKAAALAIMGKIQVNGKLPITASEQFRYGTGINS